MSIAKNTRFRAACTSFQACRTQTAPTCVQRAAHAARASTNLPSCDTGVERGDHRRISFSVVPRRLPCAAHAEWAATSALRSAQRGTQCRRRLSRQLRSYARGRLSVSMVPSSLRIAGSAPTDKSVLATVLCPEPYLREKQVAQKTCCGTGTLARLASRLASDGEPRGRGCVGVCMRGRSGGRTMRREVQCSRTYSADSGQHVAGA